MSPLPYFATSFRTSSGDLPLGVNLEFGTHTDTMNAYPSVLQP